MKNLKDKIILITGGTSGIGKSLVVKALQEDAKVAFCGRSRSKMATLLQETSEYEKNCYQEVFDILNEEDSREFVCNSINRFGKIDVLVNCAGANTQKSPVKDIVISDLEYMLKLNTIASLFTMQEAYKSMAKNGSGMIINVLSSVCQFANEGIGAYTASKASLDALSKVFRKEARNENIRISCVYPGGVDTNFRTGSRPDYLGADEVAISILDMMKMDVNTCIDELVIRPIVEKNYP